MQNLFLFLFVLLSVLANANCAYIVFRAYWSASNPSRNNCQGTPDSIAIYTYGTFSYSTCEYYTDNSCYSGGLAGSSYRDVCQFYSSVDISSTSIRPPFLGTWNELRKANYQYFTCSIAYQQSTNYGWYKNGNCVPNYSASNIWVHRIYLNQTSAEVRHNCGDYGALNCEIYCEMGTRLPTTSNPLMACISTSSSHFLVRQVQGVQYIPPSNTAPVIDNAAAASAYIVGFIVGPILFCCLFLCIGCCFICCVFACCKAYKSKPSSTSVVSTPVTHNAALVSIEVPEIEVEEKHEHFDIQQNETMHSMYSDANAESYQYAINTNVTVSTDPMYDEKYMPSVMQSTAPPEIDDTNVVQQTLYDTTASSFFNDDHLEAFVSKCVSLYVTQNNLHPSIGQECIKLLTEKFHSRSIFSFDILKQVSTDYFYRLDIPQGLASVMIQELNSPFVSF